MRLLYLLVIIGLVQLPVLLSLPVPLAAAPLTSTIRTEMYADPDNRIDPNDNGSTVDPTYSASCGSYTGAWVKGASVYTPDPADRRVTMILRYKNVGSSANQYNSYFVIYTPPNARILSYGVASTVYGEPQSAICAGLNVTSLGISSSTDPYVRGYASGEHVWFWFAPGRIPAGYTGTLFVRYLFEDNVGNPITSIA